VTISTKFNIAVVGIGLRLPNDVSTMDGLWNVLINEENLISNIKHDRFSYENYLHPRRNEPGKSYTYSAGVLSRIDEFDARFFGITPREACQIDPQQRLLLEVTWEALENGCQNIDSLAGKDCGVYIGIGSNEHMFQYTNDPAIIDSYTMLGNCSSIASNRISYVFDFHGPSMSIDTACSSSLVALHQACSSLWLGDSSMAIAGGVNLLQSPTSFIGFSKASMLSPEGQCKSFAAEGNGYVRSEGCVVLFLKPLDVAIRDNDPIHAIILNSGVNSDGNKRSIIVPSADSQAALIQKVHQQIELAVDDVDYLETHGTGTLVGDKTEATALSKALASEKKEPLMIGSIKSNVGHLEVASGLTGILKTILCLKNKIVPSTLHQEQPNPDINFRELNLKVVNSPLTLTDKNKTAIMAVNSFGFGGTNAHVILSEYKSNHHEISSISCSQQKLIPPLFLSLNDESKFSDLAQQYINFVQLQPKSYYRSAYILANRRARHKKNVLVYGNGLTEILAGLESLAEQRSSNYVLMQDKIGEQLSVALVYSGNGSQWQGMGLQLMQEPIVNETIDEIDRLFTRYADFSIKAELMAAAEQSRFAQTEIAQPCLFALQVAMTRYLLERGCVVSAVTGHSVGEIAAAWACGALSLEQATEVIYQRSYWQGRTKGQGRMMAIALNKYEAEQLIIHHGLASLVHIAAENSDKGVTLAGDSSALEALELVCEGQGTFARLLDLDYAFHTPSMDVVRRDLLSSLIELKPNQCTIPYISTVTGSSVDGYLLDAEYWWNNIRQPVQFYQAINSLIDNGIRIFVEIGPHAVLKTYIEQTLTERKISGLVLATAKKGSSQQNEDLNSALFKTWMSGAQFDPSYFFPKQERPLSLPPYMWSKESFRLQGSFENANQAHVSCEHPLLGWKIKQGESIWENHLDSLKCSYLADHVVNGKVVMPAAGYIEMALFASHSWYGNGQHDVRDLEIIAPMVFDSTVSRLVRFELLQHDGSFTIKSRLRDTVDEWVIHIYGRIIPKAFLSSSLNLETFLVAQENAQIQCTGEQLYSAAKSRDLDYGLTFQLINQVWISAEKALAQLTFESVEILELKNSHIVYPGILDACFQLLVGLLFHRGREDNTVLPVRVGRVQFFSSLPDDVYIKAHILKDSKQSILADFLILDHQGLVIVAIKECRFKKTSFSELTSGVGAYSCRAHLLAPYIQQTPTVDFSLLKALNNKIKKASLSDNKNPVAKFESIMPLIDVLIGYFIYEAFIKITTELPAWSLDTLIEQIKIHPLQKRLAQWCLNVLEEDGYLHIEPNGYYKIHLSEKEINAQELWLLLLQDNPNYLVELLLVGKVGLSLINILTGAVDALSVVSDSKSESLRQFIEDCPTNNGLNDLIEQLFVEIISQWPKLQRMKVLDVGYTLGQLSTKLMHHCVNETVDYHVLVTDGHEAQSYDLPFVTTSSLPADRFSSHEFLGEYDVLIIRNSIYMTHDLSDALTQLKNYLKPGGILIFSSFPSERMHEFIIGANDEWWNYYHTKPVSRLRTAKEIQATLDKLSFSVLEPVYEKGGSVQQGNFMLLSQLNVDATALTASSIVAEKQSMLLFTSSQHARSLINATLQDSVHILYQTVIHEEQFAVELQKLPGIISLSMNQQLPLHLVWVLDNQVLEQSCSFFCSALNDCILTIQSMNWVVQPRFTLVTTGAKTVLVNKQSKYYNSVHAALWGFVRVLSNEYPELKCKLVDLQDELSSIMVEKLIDELSKEDNEHELILTSLARYGVRVESINPWSTPGKQDNYYLDFNRSGSLMNLFWFPIREKTLASDEVRVKPKATGLNFRDVMYTMGFIPDEAVENGFLGASLGMEFSGEVVAVGASVDSVQLGDKVIGFAPASFASEVTTKAYAISPMPTGWSFSEGATVPIAYFTAYYAISFVGRLKSSERILIHGAAGGVGIAAIQLAKHIGAKIYTTAGSSEKQEFLKLMGIKHCYDSRSLSFADELLADTDGEGVHVVLNCLSGEAINANLTVLKPFGRFLELGKRDFFSNSKIGLRPFRNNISYFGIDVDQLFIEQSDLCMPLFKEMMKLFEQRVLTPLPYHEFIAENVVDSFRYMQQARHIGKIIVNLDASPCTRFIPEKNTQAMHLSLHGTYLITGAFSGFGLKTALWLADKGARHLVLVGRRGASSQEAIDALVYLNSQGVCVQSYSLDISDEQSVNEMITRCQKKSHPLKGIIHAAAVYEDAFLQDLTQEKIQRVLAPKYYGALNLHRATQELPLDFFVVYSSVTALIGNPGQANYVAANTALESLVSYRRSLGLPGLFLAWGPISDTGYLSRNQQVKDLLAANIGSNFLSSKQALYFLEQLMQIDCVGAIVTHLNAAKLKRTIPSFSSLKFALLHPNGVDSLELGEEDDIHLLIMGKPKYESLRIVVQLLTVEIGKIVRLPIDKLDSHAPLSELGIDSLVGAELVNIIQQRFSIQMSMLSLSQSASIDSLAEKILAQYYNESEVVELLSSNQTHQNVLYEAALHGEILTAETALELLE
jgi:acyl transferase domain-containing protein/NADPH:quinone reductase-like Zn-dependent oxidoreductase/acyl carrier protein/SAM-dependent methyltransferase